MASDTSDYSPRCFFNKLLVAGSRLERYNHAVIKRGRYGKINEVRVWETHLQNLVGGLNPCEKYESQLG